MERVSRKGEIEGIVKRKGIGKRRYVRFIEHYLKSRRNGVKILSLSRNRNTVSPEVGIMKKMVWVEKVFGW